MRPLRPGEIARDESFAEMFDLGVGTEKPGSVFSH
jgi:hypothetical protein